MTAAEGGRPDFGPLAGVRVVYSGQALAGPFAANLMGEFGADVLWLENPLVPDMTRVDSPFTFEMERRNQRTLALNIPTDDGRAILLDILRETDIFVESSKGGQFQRWGLGDDVLWEVNPALVIVHVSGYGQSGDPRYVGRGSFDPIGQAFGCYLQHNGPPDGDPTPAAPFTADYLSGLFAAFGALAALQRSRSTGHGDSIDVALYESLLRAGGMGPMAFLNEGRQPLRKATRRAHTAGSGIHRCKDGRAVYVILRGAGVLRRVLPILGLEIGGSLLPPGTHSVAFDTPFGEELEQRMTAYCAAHTAAEVDEVFNAHGIPCSQLYTYDVAVHDPHYLAREVFAEWQRSDGSTVRGVNVLPKLARRPGRIWRGAPRVGMDSVDVLTALGRTPAEIEDLERRGIVRTDRPAPA